MACFDGVHAFGYNSAESEPIWMKFGALKVYCPELALTDFGRDPRRSESGSPNRNFVFFLSGKQRTTLPISGRPNFTKSAHKTWICEMVNSVGTKFSKSSRKGSFFPIPVFCYPRERLPTSSGDNSLTVYIVEK